MNPCISIIIPCFNEEGNVEKLYEKITDTLPNSILEILFIDDHSTDGTLPLLEKMSGRYPNVKYLSFSRNFGHQSALRAGLEYATGDCVISMDADLQHPTALLPEMIRHWQEGSEIVYTIRKDSGHIPWFKRATSALFYRLMNSLSEVEIHKGAADFRLLDRKIVDILVNDITEYHLFYRGIISWLGFKQKGIEYIPDKRFSGDSKYSFLKMMNFAIDGITSFSIKPLKLAILLGLLLSVFSGLYGLYALGMSLFTDSTVPGWTSVMLSILFIGGVNMVLLGIIGEYIGKLYIQSKKRPLYLISKSNLTPH